MADKTGLRKWLWAQRSSSRQAYALQMGFRVLSSVFGLMWLRLISGAMGKELYSLYLAFQTFFSFGGLGDLGMGGAVSVRVGQYLGAGKSKEGELMRFLASARTVLLLAVLIGCGVMLFSPWLPEWLNFPHVASAGSLPDVFRVGALVMAGVLLSSYLNNLNYACGNIVWPVAPDWVSAQLALLCHFCLALEQEPLWIQYLPYVVAAAIRLGMTRFYVRMSHPPLAKIFPLNFDWPLTVTLFESSFWIYLCSLGNLIYRGTDNLVITAGFAPGTLLGYYANYRFCDLTVFIVLTASFVTLPKITQWMASTDPRDQQRVRVEMRKLNQFQTLLGCGAALAYLALNDFFMRGVFFHSKEPVAPAALPLQLAFALNMAVTASGDAGIQLALRSGKNGLRVAGTVIGLTGLLNLGLSLVAMKLQSLWGVAMATVVAQSILSLIASCYVCRHLQIKWLPWALKGWLAPLAGICFAGWLRLQWPMDSLAHVALLVGSYAGMLIVAAWGLGVNAAFIREELQIVRKFFGK